MKVKAPFRVTVGYACKRSDSFVRVTWNLEALQGTRLRWDGKGRVERWLYEQRIWQGIQPRKGA